jgi:hypothetical protein
LLLAAGAAAVIALSWLLGHLVPYPVVAATNSQALYRVGRVPGLATAPAFRRPVGVVIIVLLLGAVLVPLWINSDRVDKTTIRQSYVQAVADHWASNAGWSVIGVVATGDRVLVDATGPRPAPDLAVLRQDLDAAGLVGSTSGSAWSRSATSHCQDRQTEILDRTPGVTAAAHCRPASDGPARRRRLSASCRSATLCTG